MLRSPNTRTSLILFLALLIGAFGYLRAPFVHITPNTTSSQAAVQVTVSWEGSDAYVLESEVVRLLERGLSRCTGVKQIFSVTSPNSAFIYITATRHELLGELLVQAQMQVRILFPLFPAGVSWPSVHRLDATGTSDNALLLSCVWFGPESNLRSWVEELRLAFEQSDLSLRIKARWPASDHAREKQVLYDPGVLRRLDITPGELFEQIRQAYKVITLNPEADRALVYGQPLITPHDIPIRGKAFGKRRLGELARVEERNVPVYPIIRVNGQPALQVDFFAQREENLWWQSYRLAQFLKNYGREAEAQAIETWRFSAYSLYQTRYYWLFFVLLWILLLLVSAVYFKSLRPALLLCIALVVQVGMFLLFLSITGIPLDIGAVKTVLLFNILFLQLLWLSLMAALGAYYVHPKPVFSFFLLVFTLAAIGASTTFNPPGFGLSPWYQTMLFQLLSMAFVLFVFVPLCTVYFPLTQVRLYPALYPNRLINKLLLFFYWLLLVFCPFSSGTDTNQQLWSRYAQYLANAKKTDESHPYRATQIRLELNGPAPLEAFDSWITDLSSRLQPYGQVVANRSAPDKAVITVVEHPNRAIRGQDQLRNLLQVYPSRINGIDFSFEFPGKDMVSQKGLKKMSYVLQIYGYDLFTTINWTNTIIRQLSAYPRIRKVSRISPLGRNAMEGMPMELDMERSGNAGWERGLSFFEDRTWLDSRLGLRLQSRERPIFLGTYGWGDRPLQPGWIWEQLRYNSEKATNDPIVRRNQQYLETISFDFMGTPQAAEKALVSILKELSAQLPPGYRIELPNGASEEETNSGSGYLPSLGFSLLLVLILWIGAWRRLLRLVIGLLGTLPLVLWTTVLLDLSFMGGGSWELGWLMIWFLLPWMVVGLSASDPVKFSYTLRFLVAGGLAWIGASLGTISIVAAADQGFPPFWVVGVLSASLTMVVLSHGVILGSSKKEALC